LIFQTKCGKIALMKVLITGGAGYIGSHLADRFLAEGAAVTVIDNLSAGQRSNTEHNLRSSRFRFVQGDVLDRRLMEELVSGHDLVCHLAAVVGVHRVLADPLQAMLQNVGGTEIVLALAYEYGRRVLFASTSEIYGKSDQVPFAEDDDRVLGSTRIARWAYSTGKALDEHLCLAYHGQGLPVSIVRYFNSYGPRLDPKGYGSVIATFIIQAMANDPLTVHHDGRQTRCFTFIDDTVRGSMLAAISTEALGQVFNIASDVETTILALARLVLRLTRSSAELTFVPYHEAYGVDFEDIPRRVADVSKAEKLLGFRAEVPLEEGLQKTIAWFRNCPIRAQQVAGQA
jgi:UDP-glucose 4-epimerase